MSVPQTVVGGWAKGKGERRALHEWQEVRQYTTFFRLAISNLIVFFLG